MPFQRTLFAGTVPTQIQKKLTAELTEKAQTPTFEHLPDVFIGHRKQHLYQALNDGIGACLIGEKPSTLLESFCTPPENDGELIVAIVAETRFVYGRSTAETIAHYLHDQNIIDVEVMQNYRLLLQETLSNAIEHGNLGLSSEEDKGADQEQWFDAYYAKVEDMLRSDDKGKRSISIFCYVSQGFLYTWITDQGDGFDIENAYNNMDSANPFGKGLSLIGAFADAVKHKDEGRTCCFKIKNRSRQHGFAPPTRATVKEHGRILVVDDQKINRDLALHFLKSAGFAHLETAENGKEALEQVTAFKPDLILLDIMMPEMDGFETCKALKNNPETANIPVLFLSGLTDAKSRTQGYQLGAVDYVNKPIDRNEMVARTEVHILNGMMFRAMETHAARVAEDLTNAKQYQENLLPTQALLERLEKDHNLAIDSEYQATEELAGDYWSAFPVDDEHVGFTLVDFTGHGMLAALNTIGLHALFMELEHLMDDPVKLAEAINLRLERQLSVDQFATFVYVLLNTKTGNVSYVGCGSPALLLIPKNAEKPILPYDCRGLPLGIAPTEALNMKAHTFKMNPGDTLFFYSDALIETLHKNETIWEEEGLQEAMEKIRTHDGKTQLRNILKYFNRTANYPLEDDLTLLNVTYKPKG